FLLAGVAENFVAAARRYGENRALHIWRLTEHNQRLVREIVARERIRCDLAWNGSAQIAGDDEEWAEVRESAARLKQEAVRVRPVRGQMLATAPVARRVFERPAYANRGYRYWRQRPDGRLLVGGWRDTAVDEEVGEDERTTSRIQKQLEGFLRERCAEAEITHRWAGTMGFSHDALPYVGHLASGVFVNAGFTGHGMAFATATGELI